MILIRELSTAFSDQAIGEKSHNVSAARNTGFSRKSREKRLRRTRRKNSPPG
jgi:hypothetical protein